MGMGKLGEFIFNNNEQSAFKIQRVQLGIKYHFLDRRDDLVCSDEAGALP